ncbi:MAG: Ig-like domain repeat protein [Gemmatimonadota bacterium]
MASAGEYFQTPCAPGTWQDLEGQASCKVADVNFFVAEAGATEQTACPVGTTSAAGATQCTTAAKANTTTTLFSATNPSAALTVTFTATVSAAPPASGTPTGSLEFYVFSAGQSCAAPGTALGVATLNAAGQASAALTMPATGLNIVTACYAGDAAFGPSAASTTQLVGKIPTTITVDVPADGLEAGVPFVTTATLSAQAPLPLTNGGELSIRVGGTSCSDAEILENFTVDGRTTGYITQGRSVFKAGPTTIRACYGGIGSYASNEASRDVTFAPTQTSTSLASTPNASRYGSPVSFTSTITSDGVIPSIASTLELRSGSCAGALLAQRSLTGVGVPVVVEKNTVPVGANSIVACFLGSADVAASNSTPISQVVTKAPLTITASSGTKLPGQTYAVTPQYSGFVLNQSAVTPGVLTTAPTCSSAGSAAGAAPGVYATLCTGAVAPNYEAEYIAGSLTVSAVPVTLTLTAPSTQYSDKITLSATATPQSLVAGQSLTGTVQFFIDNTSVGSVALGGNGTASLIVPNAYVPGSHAAKAVFTSTNPTYSSTTPNIGPLSITKENASIVPGAANVGAIPVSQTSVVLTFGVKETSPELDPNPDPQLRAAAGDIGKVTALTATLVGVASNANYGGTCTAGAISGSGYAALRSFTCTFTATRFQVDAYTVVLAVGGSHYVGTHEDVLSVYDPAAGFVSGGGKFIDADGRRVSFGMGFTYTGKGKTGFRGGWVVVKHFDDGSICRVKSNTMNAPAVVGTTASLSGKSNYTCTNALGVITATAGNLSALGYVEDNGTPGAGQDKFWIRAYGALSMNTPAVTNARALSGGNIQVPKP